MWVSSMGQEVDTSHLSSQEENVERRKNTQQDLLLPSVNVSGGAGFPELCSQQHNDHQLYSNPREGCEGRNKHWAVL